MTEIDDPDVNDYSVADAPSIGADPEANPNAFKQEKNTYQTITASGVITKDQVFATNTTDEVIPPEAVTQYSTYLLLSKTVRPISNLTPEQFSINQKYIENAVTARKKALSIISGTSFTEENLIIKAKENPITDFVYSANLDAAKLTNNDIDEMDEDIWVTPKVVSQDFSHLPADAGVYAYEAITLFDDRYDFETGKKIRVGIAAGISGGAGNSTTEGNTVTTNEQSETGPF
jgi:hypothetical protein|tara:strand:+ start:1740 stop:2435 length:696 start_codon:yes stop_codon:yes gene_type:complete